MSFIDRHLGQLVRERRKTLSMSREELAGVLGIPAEALRRREKGEERITFAELHEIGRALGAPVTDFFQSILALLAREKPDVIAETLPRDSANPDAAFLLALLRMLQWVSGAQGLGGAEYLLGCATIAIQHEMRCEAAGKSA
jgi:transcriptional regulator with XRE-family HTH domain